MENTGGQSARKLEVSHLRDLYSSVLELCLAFQSPATINLRKNDKNIVP